ncbi:hypothetical protein NDU88_004258 [Pleurodeles waltl]|uniref:Uncharacterized protein n=1 Tax=Pleurodeles waltl TaxID=8319 RepID=A0AAV7NKK0_PLEWA|nr:hypothetical protein NDU88_004258 [Pleurodeles waltl]
MHQLPHRPHINAPAGLTKLPTRSRSSRTSGCRPDRPKRLPLGPSPPIKGERQKKRRERGRSPRHSPARPPAAVEAGAAETRAQRVPNQGPPRRATQARAVPGTKLAPPCGPQPPRTFPCSTWERLGGGRTICKKKSTDGVPRQTEPHSVAAILRDGQTTPQV